MPSQRPEKVIQFHYLTPIRVNGKQIVREVLARILRRGSKSARMVNYIFCSDKYLLSMNREHLGHDFLTDILTFDLSDSSREVKADIYISADRVRDNARTFSRSISEEIVRVIFHGALHLAGFRDKSMKEKKQMRLMEEKYLRQYREKSSPQITMPRPKDKKQ